MTPLRLYLCMFGSFVVGLVAASDRVTDGQAIVLSCIFAILALAIAITGGKS